jgi:UDP-N-acetyl-2-amino-2-deoxyglucuronate dehydrogenase
MKNFAFIGLGGYIAPRHLQAINDTGNQLLLAYDVNDSVGIIDRYFPEAKFTTEFEIFDDLLQRTKSQRPIDYISVCSPNYLHCAHSAYSLRNAADVICEKPLVLTEDDLRYLEEAQQQTGKRVHTILQLRLHEAVLAMKEKVSKLSERKEIDLTYITSRGDWYHKSWKADSRKSGGLATNIGIHFFDMLTWIFGEVEENIVHLQNDNSCAGFLRLEKADVKWFLSIDKKNLPKVANEKGMTTFRSLQIGGEEFEFSSGFTELHTKCYKDIMQGGGFGLEEAKPSLKIVQAIRNATISSDSQHMHSILTKD